MLRVDFHFEIFCDFFANSCIFVEMLFGKSKEIASWLWLKDIAVCLVIQKLMREIVFVKNLELDEFIVELNDLFFGVENIIIELFS